MTRPPRPVWPRLGSALGPLLALALVLLPGLAAAEEGAAAAAGEEAAAAAGEDVEPGAPDEVAEVERCVRGNLPLRTSVQEVRLRSFDRSGGKRTLEAKLWWKRSEDDLSRIFVEVEAPPADRGSAYLMLEREGGRDTWVYLPELQRVRRVYARGGGGSLFGTDFSYEDLEHLHSVSTGAHERVRLPDAEVEGRPAYVVRSGGLGEESSYEKIVHHVDRETCLPLRIEFYEGGGKLRKVLRADPEHFAPSGERWVARRTTMEDEVTGTRSVLEVESIDLDPEVPDRLFTLSRLRRGAH